MSSSTSSSDGRGEWRLVLSLGCALLLLEAGTRAWVARGEARASADTLNVRNLARTAAAMREHAGHKALVLGNSLAHDGVRGDMLCDALRSAGRVDAGVFLGTPSGSSAMHWDYALRRYFTLAGAVPDEIFFCGHPWHFADRPEDTARLHAFYVANADFGRALADMHGWDAKAGFVLSRISSLWGVNTGLKARLFAALVPHYEEVETRLQRLRWTLTAPDASRSATTHLKRMLDELSGLHVRAHLVAMPTLRQSSPVPGSIVETGAEGGADLIDLTAMAGLDAGCYKDGFHLNERGARLFSQQLALAVTKEAR